MDERYGIVLGELDNPEELVGIRTRPTGGSIRRWVSKLVSDGCSITVNQATSFPGWFLKCSGQDMCERLGQGRCPFERETDEPPA